MFRFLKRFQHQHDLLSTRNLQALNLRFSSQVSDSKIPSSLSISAVDYLVNSCGLSPEAASSASKKIRLKSTKKPNSVLNFFQSHGLTRTQITEIISKHPLILSSDLDKTLKPKIDFFLHSLGISSPDLWKIICSNPILLRRGLTSLQPSFDFLKSIVHTDDNVLTTLKRSIYKCNLEKTLGPNIETLRNHGVPDHTVSNLLLNHPGVLTRNTDRFSEIVEMVKQMGFDPMRRGFVEAIQVMAQLSKSSWEKKLRVYQEFGFSEEEALDIFKRQTTCMSMSEKKMMIALEFFMKKLKLKPVEVCSSPVILLYSMEKRIKPRCAVMKILDSERVSKRKVTVASILSMSEERFYREYVVKYGEKLPQVIKAYKGEEEDSEVLGGELKKKIQSVGLIAYE